MADRLRLGVVRISVTPPARRAATEGYRSVQTPFQWSSFGIVPDCRGAGFLRFLFVSPASPNGVIVFWYRVRSMRR